MKPVGFATASVTSRHGRLSNQDCAGYLHLDRVACWVVADGLGAYNGGEVAARLAVEQIMASCETRPQLTVEALKAHLEAAQSAIRARQAAQPELAAMRTTVALLVSDYQAALCAHLGDSRCYQFRGGEVCFQTRDHSVPQALVNAGDLAPEAVRFHEDRNRLLRALGEEAELKPTLSGPLDLAPGDAFLLCTDGFWEYVLEEDMQQALARADTPKSWLKAMEEKLIARVAHLEKNGADNYTAITIFLQGPLG
jgi:serine/threonine protein phosphatase PrpC